MKYLSLSRAIRSVACVACMWMIPSAGQAKDYSGVIKGMATLNSGAAVPFVYKFQFSDPSPTSLFYDNGTNTNDVHGGANTMPETVNPVSSGTLTLGGIQNTDFSGLGTSGSIYKSICDCSSAGTSAAEFRIEVTGSGGDFLNFDAIQDGASYGGYELGRTFLATGIFDNSGDRGVYGMGQASNNGLAINSITYLSVSPTPEASTWAMLLGGVGLVGASMRRKRAGESGRLFRISSCDGASLT